MMENLTQTSNLLPLSHRCGVECSQYLIDTSLLNEFIEITLALREEVIFFETVETRIAI